MGAPNVLRLCLVPPVCLRGLCPSLPISHPAPPISTMSRKIGARQNISASPSCANSPSETNPIKVLVMKLTVITRAIFNVLHSDEETERK